METPESQAPVKKAPQSSRSAAARKKVKPEAAAKPQSKAPVAKKAAASKTAKKADTKPAANAEATVPPAPADGKSKRPKKEKVVRDSFTMPKSDYVKIASLKQKCLDSGVRVKKSELLRAALAMLDAVPAKQLLDAINQLEAVKTGRPSNA
jgi:hypothetical protein